MSNSTICMLNGSADLLWVGELLYLEGVLHAHCCHVMCVLSSGSHLHTTADAQQVTCSEPVGHFATSYSNKLCWCADVLWGFIYPRACLPLVQCSQALALPFVRVVPEDVEWRALCANMTPSCLF
jgi:hypothetical protein